MEITHGIALFFALAFVLVGFFFKKVIWWGLSIGYLYGLAFIAITNDWELLFFAPTAIFGIISIIGLGNAAFKGDLL